MRLQHLLNVSRMERHRSKNELKQPQVQTRPLDRQRLPGSRKLFTPRLGDPRGRRGWEVGSGSGALLRHGPAAELVHPLDEEVEQDGREDGRGLGLEEERVDHHLEGRVHGGPFDQELHARLHDLFERCRLHHFELWKM